MLLIRKSSLSWLFGFLILTIDQTIKYLLVSYLNFGESIKGIFFDVTLVKNTGTAFGLFQNQNIFFIILSIIAIIIISIIFFKFRKDYFLFQFCLTLILSGALSNLVDRLKFGYVIDYIDFRFWPVFNIADSAITIGTTILLITVLMNKKNKEKEIYAPSTF